MRATAVVIRGGAIFKDEQRPGSACLETTTGLSARC